ncbi:MAG: hypothetical protein ABIJ40_02975, partial [Bacteroidota bacterium]
MKTAFILCYLLLVSAQLFSQERAILKPNGEIIQIEKNANHETEVFGLKTKRNSISKKNLKDKTTDATAGTPDTLRYFDTNFSTN